MTARDMNVTFESCPELYRAIHPIFGGQDGSRIVENGSIGSRSAAVLKPWIEHVALNMTMLLSFPFCLWHIEQPSAQRLRPLVLITCVVRPGKIALGLSER
jgi:hypothetical protein